jgi:hypothetical protein
MQKWNHGKLQYTGYGWPKKPNLARKATPNFDKVEKRANFGRECALIFETKKT